MSSDQGQRGGWIGFGARSPFLVATLLALVSCGAAPPEAPLDAASEEHGEGPAGQLVVEPGDRVLLGLRSQTGVAELAARLRPLGLQLLCVRPPLALARSDVRGRLAVPALASWVEPATGAGVASITARDAALGDAAATLLAPTHLDATPGDGPDEPFEDPPFEEGAPTTTLLKGDAPPFGEGITDTSRFMVGTVAVALVLPESTGGIDPNTESWTAGEVALVQARAQAALAWLAEREPSARLSFVLDLPSAPPPGGVAGTIATDYEPVLRFTKAGGWNFDEDVWADVLSRVGPPGGFTTGTVAQRRLAYARFLREKHRTNWAIVLLVADNSDLRLGRASALLFGPAAVLFSSVGASVYAHETGHLFGAKDEYHPDAGQPPSALQGWLGVANANSQFDDGTGFVEGHGESVPSLMLNNTSYLTPYTRIAWGWLDSDGDGLVDLFDQPPVVAVGALAGSGPFSLEATATVGTLPPVGSLLSGALSLDAIAAVEWRVTPLGGASGPWRPATPVDGAFDSGHEVAVVEIPPLPEGSWVTEVRARTLEGQTGIRRLDAPLAVRRGATPVAVLAGLDAPALAVTGAPVVLDATGSAAWGAQARARWDLDGDGTWDTALTTELTTTVTWSTPGVVQPRVEVQAGDAVSVAAAAVEVVEGSLPPDASFVVTPAHAVGVGEQVLVTATPAGVGVGRWDWDGDGLADTPWEPLGAASRALSIPGLRVAIRGSVANPDGRAWRAVVQREAVGWVVDADRQQVLAVDVSDPAAPSIVAAATLPGLHRASELALVGDDLVVTRGAAGATRLVAQPQGGALVVAGDLPPFGDATGLALMGGGLMVADGAGVAVVDTATWALVSHEPHAAPGRIVDVDAGAVACAVVAEEGDPYAGALVTLDLDGTPRATVSLATLGGLHGSAPSAVRVHGSLCLVADAGSGVRIFDVSDPEVPVLRSTLGVEGVVTDVAASGDWLYVASGIQLHLFDLAEPDAPSPLTAVALRSPRGLWLGDDGLLHIAGGVSGYQIAEVVDGPWRSGAFTVGLEVGGTASAVARRQVTAVSYGGAPVAALVASATPTHVTLDAGGSTDPDVASPWDGLLLARWDLDGDGAWDTTFSPALSLKVPAGAPGVQRVRVQVRDRFWAASEAEAQVCVPGPQGPVSERCGNGRDDDCDGETDEGFGSLGGECTEGTGDCEAFGQWLCDPVSGQLLCGVPEGSQAIELCGNAVDDDCDGETDEGFDLVGQPCTAGLGGCEAAGVWECAGGALGCSAAEGVPAPEECNGKDDDCNGLTDDGGVPAGGCDGPDSGGCAAGAWVCQEGALLCVGDSPGGVSELCDGLDNDCDGLVDEVWPTLGGECDGPDGDSCRRGKVVCAQDAKGVACNEDPALVTPELCNGVDDDCDKLVDEGFQPPGTPCDGPDDDTCPTGLAECSPDGLSVACEELGPAGVEVCNGVDDDCDGDTDEGFGAGEPCDGHDDDLCADGVIVCKGGWVACDEAPGPGHVELCNWLDDDCDGDTDEGYGPLGMACDGPDVDDCETGWLACAPDGLSAICPEVGPTPEKCNGMDDDCDGETDEDFPLGELCDGPDIDVCKNGVWECSPGGDKVACGPESPANLLELCNGLDDDCDGSTDEGCK
ncbi:MAG: hypothetical protein AMXMBFR64_03820 [Myxococcales bacterium]